MAKKNWEIYLGKAKESKRKSEGYLDEAVRSLMASKGFATEQTLMFEACFASGDETVISFNKECEMADLDVGVAAKMTKDEIIERLSRDASDETIKLLKG